MSSSEVAISPKSEDIAISIRNVSKKFRLFANPADRLKEAFHPFRKTYHKDFWALNDINFNVHQGEIVGILGRNGSGKSTLLQLICGVMQPTTGTIETAGRISALLELGAGFNPEFTGRENVILNGAIMGFTAEEMKQRMPAIEAFADVGAFFDQPVKTYSSGMFVRVAFAAAINIDPEILIVDEALSVGDAKFQHKCYGRIEKFREAGKTILLVTHDIGQITAHCDRAILINESRVLMDGSPRDVVDKYIEMLFADGTQSDDALDKEGASPNEPARDRLASSEDNGATAIALLMKDGRLEQRPYFCEGEARYGNRAAEIVDCIFESGDVLNPYRIESGREVTIYFKVLFYRDILPSYGFAIKSRTGIELYGSNTYMQRVKQAIVPAGESRIVSFTFKANLPVGEYFFDIGISSPDGTDGGDVADARRSVVMMRVMSDEKPTYNGIVDLQPEFCLVECK